MDSHHLPRQRSLITSLFGSLPIAPDSPSTTPSNPLLAASSSTESLFLTLHCLFPAELLPALDLLDKGLVARSVERNITMVDSPTDDTTAKGVEATRKRSARLPFASRNSVMVYYVRSAQPTRSTTRYQYVAGSATSYEVRLRAWNCTCAAFTFSVLSGLGRGGQEREDAEGNGWEESKSWFGGLLMDQNGIPICKHLLACILVERSEALAGYVEEKIVNQEEAAGWGAGWGG